MKNLLLIFTVISVLICSGCSTSFVEVPSHDQLLYAIQKLEDVEKPMTYLKAIIKDYMKNNISTVKQAIEHDKVFKEKKNKNNKKNKSERKQKLEDLYNSATGPILDGYYDWMNE